MRSIDKVKIDRIKKTREKNTINLDYEQRLGLIEKTQDIIAGHLKDLSQKEVPTVKYIEPSLTALNKQLINLITLWSDGFQINNIKDARVTIPDEFYIKNQLKLPEWMKKAPKQNNTEIVEAIKQNAKLLGEIKKSSGDQQASSFIPIRRVVKLGTRMVFDDNATSQGGAGGNNSIPLKNGSIPVVNPDGSLVGSSSAALTNDGTFATPARQDTGNTSLSSIDTKLTTQATATKQDTGNTSLSSIDTKLTSQATASNQTTGNSSLASIKTNTDPFLVSNAGGYIRQDSTATIAKESGGNLATIAGKDFATQTTLATRLSESDFDTKTGSLTETAPATDTASSGINGRLQRVAQRITSLIALLPTALGTSGGLKVDGSGTPLPISGTITANPTTPSTLLAFITTVTTAGTRVQLATNSCVAGIVEAPSTNGGKVYVGGSNVSSTVFGSELQPGQSAGIAIDNTNKLYVDSATNGDKLAFFGS